MAAGSEKRNGPLCELHELHDDGLLSLRRDTGSRNAHQPTDCRSLLDVFIHSRKGRLDTVNVRCVCHSKTLVARPAQCL